MKAVTVRVEVLEGTLFLQKQGNASCQEGAPALALSGSSSMFDAHVCMFDLPDEYDTNAHGGGQLVRFQELGAADCPLYLAPHAQDGATCDPLVMPFLVSQRSISNKGYPIQKTIAHAINAPRLSELTNGRVWEGILVFIDMCGYQEVSFLTHMNALEKQARQDGVMIEALWTNKVFNQSVQSGSEWHPRDLPFYVRGGIRVRMSAVLPQMTAALRPAGVASQRDVMAVESWSERMEAARTAQERMEVASRIPDTASRTYMRDPAIAQGLQDAFKAYIDMARLPYTREGGWGNLAPYATQWSHFVVPQYMTTTGLETPAGPLAISSTYPLDHDTLEAFFAACIEDTCERLGVSTATFTDTMRNVHDVYTRRRANAFADDTAAERRESGTPALPRMTRGAIDLMCATVDTVFTSTTSSMTYTTDTTAVLGRRSFNDAYRRPLDKLAGKSCKMEVERITVDLLRCVGFDCEDGSMFHYRLHMLLCQCRFVYNRPYVAAFADVMDLYMPCIAKMQCGGSPLTGSPSSLVCHILSWLILRDEAHRMMTRGVEYSGDVAAGALSRTQALYAADRTAYMRPTLYQEDERARKTIDKILSAEQLSSTPNEQERFYPLPITLCLEPTAPVPCQQMPCAAHYPDASRDDMRSIRQDHSTRLVNVRMVQQQLHEVVQAPPVLSAFPDESHGVDAARRNPFQYAYSPFYRGVLSFWMPDSGFLCAVERARDTLRNDTLADVPDTCVVDYVCAVVDTNNRTARLGVPHNLFVTCNTKQERASPYRVAMIPSAPFSGGLVTALARVVADEKCPENPTGELDPNAYTRPEAARQRGGERMPNIARDAANRMPNTARIVGSGVAGQQDLETCMQRDTRELVHIVPADMNLFYEKDIARVLERAMHSESLMAARAYASRIGVPMFTRVRAVVDDNTARRVVREVFMLRVDESCSHDRLIELCGAHVTEAIMNESSPRHAAMCSILGAQMDAYRTDYTKRCELIRGAAQYILDHTSVMRHAIDVQV